MSKNLTLAGCPLDCDEVLDLPAIEAEQDCTNYEQTLSQIKDLYLGPSGAADMFAAWAGGTPTYVAASIDNTAADGTKWFHLVGIGEEPVPAKTVTQYPGNKEKVTNKLFTLTYRVLNLSAAMRTFLQKLECGSTDFSFYYTNDLGKLVYGLPGGIMPKSADCDFPKAAGNEDKNVAIVTITYDANASMQARPNPAA